MRFGLSGTQECLPLCMVKQLTACTARGLCFPELYCTHVAFELSGTQNCLSLCVVSKLTACTAGGLCFPELCCTHLSCELSGTQSSLQLCMVRKVTACITGEVGLAHLKACIAAFNFAILLKGLEDLPSPLLVLGVSSESPHVEEGLQHFRPQLVCIVARLHVICWVEPHHFWCQA